MLLHPHRDAHAKLPLGSLITPLSHSPAVSIARAAKWWRHSRNPSHLIDDDRGSDSRAKAASCQLDTRGNWNRGDLDGRQDSWTGSDPYVETRAWPTREIQRAVAHPSASANQPNVEVSIVAVGPLPTRWHERMWEARKNARGYDVR